MIVYLARDIPAFIMYCVNGESRSSLLIESTDSMIYIYIAVILLQYKVLYNWLFIRALYLCEYASKTKIAQI